MSEDYFFNAVRVSTTDVKFRHPEIVDEEDDDNNNDGDENMEDAPNGVPPVPKVPNGEKS